MSSARRHAAPRAQAGVTLIELTMFIVIIAVAVVGILGVLSLTTRNSADPQLRKQALVIAEGLLEEIELARFTYCALDDPAAGTATGVAGCATPEAPGIQGAASGRPFDNVNDYVNQYNQAVSYTRDAAGVAFPAGYVARVLISPVVVSGTGLQPGPVTADVAALRIAVTVSYGGNQQVVLDGYRTRHAPNSIP